MEGSDIRIQSNFVFNDYKEEFKLTNVNETDVRDFNLHCNNKYSKRHL